MTPDRARDDGTYVDVSAWTDESEAADAPVPPTVDPAPTAEPAPRRRRPWRFALLGVVLGLGIVWGVWSLGNDPAQQQMPADHPPIEAAAATPTPLSAEEMSALRAKVDANPDSLDDRLIYGVALYNEERYAEAEEQWLAAAEVAPADPGPWYNLGFLYLSTDPPQDAKAEAAWRKVVELAPGTSMAQTVTEHLARLDTPLPEK